ncbi:hypothetical protein FA95DRAFT_1497685 [Auriscalpium vulgare]|uniref:Uncharacterized protein n=1 Tax=Auriscalpium vulgare TaxID=40419 RepID=A0ACB8RIV3_9AGAM|nr:hypothetical protein FA95DRAFT_1497685 [Auriscalpium vulgare]
MHTTSSGNTRPWTGQTRPTSTARPRTGQSRPGTARPTTAASSRHEASFVVAVLEGRGVAHEVGIAALDRDTGRAVLIQLADCQTYVKTLHQMHLHNPCLILVPDTFLSIADSAFTSHGKTSTATTLLVQCIQDEFPGVPLEPVLRKYWNDDAGLQFIDQLCVQDDERAATLLAASSKYYALSAAAALFKHAEIKMNTTFLNASLLIRFVPVEGTMLIDPETARNLELVGNRTFKKSAHSLFGVLNHTYTAMAGRLLRANILAPVTVQASVDARLDVVEELVQAEDMFTSLRDALKPFNKMDFDKLISSLVSSEARASEGASARTASNRVTQMLNLRTVVRCLPAVQRALGGSKSQLLQIICELLSDQRIPKIETQICASLNEDAALQKTGIGAVNARVYAVKANCNPLLDVARETYKENVGDIQALHRALVEQHDLPIALIYQDSGFAFAMKKGDLDGKLPSGFTNEAVQKGRYVFSSVDLQKRNARMKDALDESLSLSMTTINSLVARIVEDIGALYKASEAIALLDMLWSFAHVSICTWLLRPEFTGTLAIKAGRHPILENVQSAGTLVPNDVYCSDSSAFQIIQGPKYAHVFTYLKQIGLLTIMAMCGCFVPAEYGSFRIHDALLTRLSNDDDMEKSLSTFANEMASSAMILGLATSQTLVLIDELGRGTSTKEGVAISHAIGEALINMQCFVFFATHYHELSITLSRQPTVVKCVHLLARKTRLSSSSIGLAFQYRIVDGVPEGVDHYGIDLARLADLPHDVLVNGRTNAVRLAELEAQQHESSDSSKMAIRRKALLKLRTQLRQALDHSTLPPEDLRKYLARLQKDITKTLHENL